MSYSENAGGRRAGAWNEIKGLHRYCARGAVAAMERKIRRHVSCSTARTLATASAPLSFIHATLLLFHHFMMAVS